MKNAVVGLVIGGDHAVVAEHAIGRDMQLVQGMCLFAMEIASGVQAGPYDDTQARNYVERLLAGGELP